MDLRAEIDQQNAEIELLKSIVRRHLRYYPATDVMVIRKDMPPMTVEMRKKLVEVCKADSV
jgi:ribosome recycling factor